MSPHNPNTNTTCSSPNSSTNNPQTDSPPPYTHTDPQPHNSSPPAYFTRPMPLPRQHPRPRDSDLESLTEFLPWITHSPTTITFTASNSTPQPSRPRPTLAPLYIPPPSPTAQASRASPTETNIPFTNHYVLSTQSLHLYQQQSFAGDSTRMSVTALHTTSHHASKPPPRGARHTTKFGGGGGGTTRHVFIDDKGVVRARNGVGMGSIMMKKKGGRGKLGLSICSWVLVSMGIVATVGFIVGTVYVLKQKEV